MTATVPATAWERITEALARTTGHTGRGTEWRCPAHDDHNASLSVTRGPDRVLIHCHAGCDTDTILARLQLDRADLFDQQTSSDQMVLTATYRYHDAGGQVVGEVLRYTPKTFRQRRPDSRGGWEWKAPHQRVLYRLPELLAGIERGERIYITEGEKDADTVTAAGAVATCNLGGAGKWRPEYAHTLTGAAEIVIIADRDTPGYRHARQIRDSLHGTGPVHVVHALEGKDAADHLAAGHPLDELQHVGNLDQLCGENQPDSDRHPEMPPAETAGHARAAIITSRLLTPKDVDQLVDPGWLIDRYIPAGGLAAIFGRPGSYKTFLALDWACSVATGTWWNRHPVTAGPVIYVMAEGVGGLRRRKQAWEAHQRVHLNDFPIAWYPQPLDLLDPEWAEGLAIAAAHHQAALVVIDTVARAMPGGDENTSRDMGRLIAAADRTRETTGGAVILVHHTPLEANRLRGHGSLEGAVDTTVGVESDGTTIKIWVPKQKDAEEPEPMFLHPEPAGESIVLQPGNGSTDEISPAQLEMLQSLADIDLGMGVTNTQWIQCQTGVAPRTAQRVIKRLLETGHCHMVTGQPGERGARYGITDQGKEAITR